MNTPSPIDLAIAAPRIWPVILSGGSGTRLWPLSRTARPKQMLALAGAETMLVATAGRVADRTRFHAPIVVTGAGHVAAIREQLGASVALVVEPAARNTAAAIALAALAVAETDPDGLVLVMPSDHQVAAPEALMVAVAAAAASAADGWLVTFGIRAATPETGYGYIRAGDAIAHGVARALAFIEKPDHDRARGFVQDGGYSWNSGIFLFSARTMLAALAAHAPAVLGGARVAMAAASRDGARIDPCATAFAAVPSISIDHAVFEHAARVAVCPVDPGWSDIGSWDALHGIGVADADGNVVSGRVEAHDARGCLLRAEGIVLGVIGVRNLNIVATPDAVLVCARGDGQHVKTIAARLAGDPVLARPVVQAHDWGIETVVHDGGGVPASRLALLPGASVAIAAGTNLLLLDGAADHEGTPVPAGRLVVATGPVTAGAQGATLLQIG
ncbi:MAG: mannose-1-phosphate guanylyltransferase [Sandarakinorhabdus sp.]|nr:mannose-1-phosphate guanylyltransferase [Sandarakinorhabdus sp.]